MQTDCLKIMAFTTKRAARIAGEKYLFGKKARQCVTAVTNFPRTVMWAKTLTPSSRFVTAKV